MPNYSSRPDLYFEAVSLCVRNNNPDPLQQWTRIADIDSVTNELKEFTQDPKRESTPTAKWYAYDNRLTMPSRKNEPLVKEGEIAVFLWSDQPSSDSGDKTYTTIHEQNYQLPIQVVPINADTSEQAVKMLQEGVPYGNLKCRTIYTLNASGTFYEGILVSPGDLEMRQGKYALKPSVATLRLYNFTRKDILELPALRKYTNDYSTRFLRQVDPEYMYTDLFVKDPMEIVKDCILANSATTWKSFRNFVSNAEYTNKGLNTFKAFLENVRGGQLYHDVANKAGCTIKDAQRYVNTFIANANQYLDGNEIDTETLSMLVEANDTLRNRYVAAVEEKWLSTASAKVQATQSQIAMLEKKQAEYSEELAKTEVAVNAAQTQLKTLTDSIQKNTRIANESYSRVQDKLTAAREDVAAFLSDISLYLPAQGASSKLEPSKVLAAETVTDWKVITSILADNLNNAAGITKTQEHRRHFANLLYASYVNHQALLLAGPNAEEIAHAFSASVFGKTADVLICSGEPDMNLIDRAFDGEGVLAICNGLHSDWLPVLLRMVGKTNRQVFFCQPYGDDLAVEPSGLFQQLLPVYTEEFVEERPNLSKLNAAMLDKSCKQFIVNNNKYPLPGYADVLKLRPRMRQKMSSLLSDMLVMEREFGKSNNGYFGQYVLASYALATGHEGDLREAAKTDNKTPVDEKKMLYVALGEVA